MDDPDLLAAYRGYYWHVSFAQASRALELSGLRPASVLDMGSGPGPMAAAAAARGARSFVLVDASAKALEAARSDLADRNPDAAVRTLTGDLGSVDLSGLGPFDLVIFGHSLNEVAAGRSDSIPTRARIVLRAAERLAPGGSVLVVEPATLAASRDALSLRDSLVGMGWSVRAPCLCQGPCPALATGPSHTCHDEAPWDVPRSVLETAKALGLDRELIKMTWFSLQPPTPGIRLNSISGENTLPPLSASGLMLNSINPASPPPERYRVVSEPMLNKAGRVRYILCGADVRVTFSARKDDEAARRGGFFALRRYDLIDVRQPERREAGLGFAEGTVLKKVEAATLAGPRLPG